MDPAVDEFDEDEGAGPYGGSDVHGAVVLVEREDVVGDGEFDYRRVCELHVLFFYSDFGFQRGIEKSKEVFND